VRRVTKSLMIVLSLAALVGTLATTTQASELIDAHALAGGTSMPGSFAHLDWGVENITTDTTLSVLVKAYVVYANGLRQLIFPPKVHTLEPGESFITAGFFIVRKKAGLGTATFHVDARVTRVERGARGSGDFDSDTDTFEVVAP
jgi:hypothetical protein